MEARFGATLRMGTELLEERVLNGPTSNVTDSFEPFTHEPCRVVERPVVVTWMNRYRDEPSLGVLLATTRQFLAKPDVPVIAERLETFLTLATWNEQTESSNIPWILSQVAHWQRNIVILPGVPTISYPNRRSAH